MKHGLFAIVLVCLIGCTTTRERTDTLCAVARQSAQHGSQDWLRAHPEHREAFKLVADALRGQTNPEPFMALMSSLPTSTLRGPTGELYVSDALVVWDGKATRVTGACEQPVMKATLSGLKAALLPMPPAPLKTSRLKTNEVHVTNVVTVHWITNTVYQSEPPKWQQWQQYYTNNTIPANSPIFTPTVAVTNTTTYQPGFGHLGNAELVDFTNSAGKRAKIWRPAQHEAYQK